MTDKWVEEAADEAGGYKNPEQAKSVIRAQGRQMVFAVVPSVTHQIMALTSAITVVSAGLAA